MATVILPFAGGRVNDMGTVFSVGHARAGRALGLRIGRGCRAIIVPRQRIGQFILELANPAGRKPEFMGDHQPRPLTAHLGKHSENFADFAAAATRGSWGEIARDACDGLATR